MTFDAESDRVLSQLMDVSRSDLKSHLVHRMRGHCADAVPLLTRREVQKCEYYLSGYSDALKEFVILPINRSEMQAFLKERAFEFLLKELSDAIDKI